MQIRYYLIRLSVICSFSLASYVVLASSDVTQQNRPTYKNRVKQTLQPTKVVPSSTPDNHGTKELDIEISPNEVVLVPQDSLPQFTAKGKQKKDTVAQATQLSIEPEIVEGYIPPAEVRTTTKPNSPVAVEGEVTEPELLVTKGNAVTPEASPDANEAADRQHAEPELTIDAPKVKDDKSDFVPKGASTNNNAYTQAPMKGIPWMVFDNNIEEKNFGKVRLGERPSHTFTFTNYGDTDLEIELVSTCDCTTVEHSKEKIAPGASGYLKATFNSSAVYPEGVNRLSEKEITIVLKNTYPTNGYQIVKTLTIKAFVE